jgi:hypothetical protein
MNKDSDMSTPLDADCAAAETGAAVDPSPAALRERALRRGWRRMALPVCSVAGVCMAFAIVVAWFPHNSEAWSMPLQEIDAPAHYYFIRKIMREGLGAATHLWPNETYYPPMFHLLVVALISLARCFGQTLNIYAAFNIIWITFAGLVWPAGVSLYASYWTRRVDAVARVVSTGGSSVGYGRPAAPTPWRPFSCAMMLIVPVLSVCSVSHPFQMLASGPLIAFGVATSLLPYWLYVTMRLFDAIADRHNVTGWLIATVLVGALCMFAHPRIAFTWLLLMAPFILLRLPWKLIVTALASVVVAAFVFFGYMKAHYRSSRYLNPSSWFHTFRPNRTVPEALRIVVTNNIAGWTGRFMAAVIVVSAAVAVAAMLRPRLFSGAINGDAARNPDGRNTVEEAANGQTCEPAGVDATLWPARRIRTDAICLVLDFLLVGLIYVCSTCLTGWFANIVTAAWYRSETRPLTMIPFGVLPLVVFAACLVARGVHLPANVGAANGRAAGTGEVATPLLSRRMGQAVVVIVLAALALAGQVGNVRRDDLSRLVSSNTTFEGKSEQEQLTADKYDILSKTVAITGTDALIISDPLNGSMYGATLFDANMLFPIYNPAHEGKGVIFTQAEQGFGSGDPASLKAAVCPIGGSGTPKYFLSMGPQAPSLQMFTARQQFDVFHRQDLIDAYVKAGVLTKVKDFGSYGPYARGWALYSIGCPSAR